MAINKKPSVGFNAEGRFRKMAYNQDIRLRALQNSSNNEATLPPVVSVLQNYQVDFNAICARLKPQTGIGQ